MRHICAACFPANIPYFKYNWKKESWNFFFVAGILLGSFLAMYFLRNPGNIVVDEKLAGELAGYGITDYGGMVPKQLFSFASLFTLRGLIMMVAGGFLVGFGTPYAGGRTSSHSIMGLSNLQWPSLVATICFMAGGFIMTNLLLPIIMLL